MIVDAAKVNGHQHQNPQRRDLVFAILISACSSDSDSHDESEGIATQSTCPSDSAPTYDLFGREFMES